MSRLVRAARRGREPQRASLLLKDCTRLTLWLLDDIGYLDAHRLAGTEVERDIGAYRDFATRGGVLSDHGSLRSSIVALRTLPDAESCALQDRTRLAF